MRSNKIEAYKKSLKLTRDQREILVGLLLGNSCLETQNGGRTYRLKIEYSVKNQDYAQHIYEVFKEWVLTLPKKKVKANGEHHSTNVAFSTISHGTFRYYAHQFYAEGKKVVPRSIGKLLQAKGLAYWFMDDGSVKSKESKGVIFNTQGFTRSEVAKLVTVLKEKFHLDAWERKQKEGYQIYISGRSYEKFVKLVSPYIHPSMRYKIPKARRT